MHQYDNKYVYFLVEEFTFEVTQCLLIVFPQEIELFEKKLKS